MTIHQAKSGMNQFHVVMVQAHSISKLDGLVMYNLC